MFDKFAIGPITTASCGTKFALVRSTPELIELLLSIDKYNRQKKTTNLKLLAKSMQQGKFMFNAQAICVSSAGYILNGGHRINELSNTGAVVEFLLAWNMPIDRWTSFDNGAERKVNDYMELKSREFGLGAPLGEIRATMGYVIALEAGNIRKQRGGVKAMGLTLDDMAAHFDRLENELVASYNYVKTYIGTDAAPNTIMFGPKTLWAAMHVMFARKNSVAANRFFETMRNPEVGEEHPAKKALQMINALRWDTVREKKENYVTAANAAQKAFDFMLEYY